MKRILVTPENPVTILTGVYPEYLKEGIGIDCLHVILTRSGSADVEINFKPFKQTAGTITILYPNDVIMVKSHDEDYHIEYLVATPGMLFDVFNDLDRIHLDRIDKINLIHSQTIASITDAMLSIISTNLSMDKVPVAQSVAVFQLKSFFTSLAVYLANKGYETSAFTNRGDELFSKFITLLATNYHQNRNVQYYADQLNITQRYLTLICLNHTGKTAKVLIDEYVIMKIRLELRSTDIPVSELTWSFHFATTAFFCEYFRKHTGMTPTEYRKKY